VVACERQRIVLGIVGTHMFYFTRLRVIRQLLSMRVLGPIPFKYDGFLDAKAQGRRVFLHMSAKPLRLCASLFEWYWF
ncbi:hypothetical protein, partial [Candidatus Viridilinea mediisalina]